MRKKTFDGPLKGDRDYIQGPDLFNWAFKTLHQCERCPPDEFELAFHRMARRQVAMVWGTDSEPEDAIAVGSLLRDGKRDRFWMIELAAPVTGRQPYPEDKIVANISFEDGFNRASLGSGLPYSDMELWVSIIKAMHQNRFDAAGKKWVFVRAKVWSMVDKPCQQLGAELAAHFGTKLTRNVVYRDDDKVGEVYFALI